MRSRFCFDARDFGALGDGLADDTDSIARAISACSQSNGGRVVLRAGTYATGPIELRSGVELHLEAGATVLFSRNFDDYPLRLTNFEGQETVRCLSPLWGEGLHNVAITGQGIFDGQGEAWRPVKRFKLSEKEWVDLTTSGGVVDETCSTWWPTPDAMNGEKVTRRLRAAQENGAPLRIENYEAVRDFLRPNMVKLVECRQVRIDGPTFRNSPAWNIHLLMCEDVTVRNSSILNPWFAQNGDGLDIESCRNVLVSNCLIDVGDDAICLKSGKDEEGRRRNRPCEKISIRDCTVLHGHGAVVVGSEMSGGVRDVEVSNCTFTGTEVGIRFKTARGRGGVVERIRINDIEMSGIEGAAISFNMYYQGTEWSEGADLEVPSAPRSEATPQFRDVLIQNVSCRGAGRAIELRGLPEMPVEGIVLEDIHIEAERGALLCDAQNVVLRDVKLITSRLPALQCHNVRGLTMQDVSAGIQPNEVLASASESVWHPSLNGSPSLIN